MPSDPEPQQPVSLFAWCLSVLVSISLGLFAYRVWMEKQNPPLARDEPSLAERSPATSRRMSQGPSTGTPTTQPRDGTHEGSRLSIHCLSGGEPEQSAPADPSNYGPRLAADWQGRPVNNRPALIVLHETVVDEAAALALFRSPHNSDGQQASYHVLIGRDGRRIRVVPDTERAFGAGDSDFRGLGLQLKPGLRPSVNNVALHVSLVSPPDGADGERRDHSGYSPAQYSSLASQIAQWQALYSIQPQAVVTHQEVDRSGTRRDPRSFNWDSLSLDLRNRWLACGGSAPIANLGR